MAAALLLLGLLAAPTLALRGAESPWAWNIAVIYKRNNPFSVAAKDAVKANLCARFAISPCEVTPNGKPGDIYLAADLDVHVPHKYFSDVIVWLQLQRSKTVNGQLSARRGDGAVCARPRGPRAADPLGDPFSERQPRTDFGAARARDGASDRVQGFDGRIKASAGAEEPGGPRGRAQTAPSRRRAESCPSARARSPTPTAARPWPRTVPRGSAEAMAAAGRAASARGAAATTCRAAPAAESCPKWPSLGRLPRGAANGATRPYWIE